MVASKSVQIQRVETEIIQISVMHVLDTICDIFRRKTGHLKVHPREVTTQIWAIF